MRNGTICVVSEPTTYTRGYEVIENVNGGAALGFTLDKINAKPVFVRFGSIALILGRPFIGSTRWSCLVNGHVIVMASIYLTPLYV